MENSSLMSLCLKTVVKSKVKFHEFCIANKIILLFFNSLLMFYLTSQYSRVFFINQVLHLTLVYVSKQISPTKLNIVLCFKTDLATCAPAILSFPRAILTTVVPNVFTTHIVIQGKFSITI